jgi:hypothetical protein
MTSIQSTRSRLLAIGMVAGPLLVIIGGLLFPAASTMHGTYEKIAAMGNSFLAVNALIALGWGLFLCSIAVLARLTPARGGRLTLVGGILIALGALATSGADWGGAIIQTSVGASLDAEVSKALETHGLGLVLLLPMFLVAIGLILSAVGLLRARTASRVAAVLILIGAFIATFAGAVGPISDVLLLPLAVGFFLLARSTGTSSEKKGGTSAEVPAEKLQAADR